MICAGTVAPYFLRVFAICAAPFNFKPFSFKFGTCLTLKVLAPSLTGAPATREADRRAVVAAR